MAYTGSGTGTPIVIPTPTSPLDGTFFEGARLDGLALPLALYPSLVGYDECAFWGVLTQHNQAESDCSELWTETNRMLLFYGLQQAQQMIEDYVGFFLTPTFVSGKFADSPFDNFRFVDNHAYCPTLNTKWRNIIEFGDRVEEFIEEGATVTYAADPVVLGPFVIELGDIYELKIYHPGSNREITPSKIIYASGSLTIHIPRCRLVKEELLSIGTKDDGLHYENDLFFEETVDIKRIYADTTHQVDLVSPHSCNAFCSSTLCTEHTQTGCAFVQDARQGFIQVSPGNYIEATNSWRYTNSNFCSCNYQTARLYYRSGLKYLSWNIYDMILRLTHTLIPDELCSCGHVAHILNRDREIPRNLTRAKQNNPFGEMTGAWFAFKVAQRMKIWRAGVLQ